MVELLNRAAGSDAEVRAQGFEGGDSVAQCREGAGDAADLIVHRRRTIERDDEVVNVLGDLRRTALYQESAGENGDADAVRADSGAHIKESGVHEWLAARENHPFGTERLELVEMVENQRWRHLAGFGVLPDIAHRAAAIAARVDIENQNREATKNQESTSRPARRM